jgi:LmbE family N-acetylglucosaminyl deacetylase
VNNAENSELQAAAIQGPVLVIAAHPDDEVLGCGGTMALYARRGVRVVVVIATTGRAADAGGHWNAQNSYTRNAMEALGVRDVRFLGFPDQGLDTITLTEIISPLEEMVAEVRPPLIFCQYGGDVNRDHSLLFEAVLVATRPTEEFIEAVYAFETSSSTEWAYPRSFVPDTWVEVSTTLEAKLAAMACYQSELREYPHPRSLGALRHKAAARGNECCMRAAEVFMTVRRVHRNGRTPV